MLDSIKKAIEDLPETPFEDYYQKYVSATQDRIINATVRQSEKVLSSADTNIVLQGLNTLTEELKEL